jgi:hypothetical protein
VERTTLQRAGHSTCLCSNELKCVRVLRLNDASSSTIVRYASFFSSVTERFVMLRLPARQYCYECCRLNAANSVSCIPASSAEQARHEVKPWYDVITRAVITQSV